VNSAWQAYVTNPTIQATVNIALILGILAAIARSVVGAHRRPGEIRHPLFGKFTLHVPNMMSLFRFPLGAWLLAVHLLPVMSSPLWNLSLHVAFGITCLFDFLDGKFARDWNAITEDGKSLDPAADKFVTFCMAYTTYRFGELPWWALAIVIGREVISVAQRMLMKRHGKDVSAGWLGKLKTGVQFVMLYILALRIGYQPGTIGIDTIVAQFSDGAVLWGIILLCFITVISIFPFFDTFWYVNTYKKSRRGESSRPWYLVAIPNGFTIGNYLCGVTAVYFAMPQVEVLYRPFVILFWVMSGAFCDTLDGPIARKLKVHSEFGSCLDNSTDLSTFGLAVGTIVFLVFFAMDAVHPITAMGVTLFYFAMVHLRLARFSELSERDPTPGKKKDFVGMPSPAGGIGVLVILTLYHDLARMTPFEAVTLTTLILGVSLLMYSEYDFISHANAIHAPLYRYSMIPVICIGFGMLTVLNFQQPFVADHFSRELIYYFRACSWIMTASLVVYIIDGIRRGKAVA